MYYRIFNADGREVEQCGNGARCIARYLGERAGAPQAELVLDSPGGLVQAKLDGDRVSVTMGVPDFEPGVAALRGERRGLRLSALGRRERGRDRRGFGRQPARGDPRARPSPTRRSRGSAPRSSTTRASRSAPTSASWKSSTAATSACGCTSAARARPGPAAPGPARRSPSAAGTACSTNRYRSTCPGGRLDIQWDGPGEPIWMTGPAERAFEGEVKL